MFKAVSAKVDIQKLERDQLNFWREKKIFQRTMSEREGNESFVFYEGPPTANGKPGSHHVLARAFKDMFPRYKVMRGYYCLRSGGWDTHGLPVEIEVEKGDVAFEDARRLDVGGVVRAHDDDVVAGIEQRDRNDEERRGRSRGEQHIVRAEPAAGARGEQRAQARMPGMVGVGEGERAQIGEAEIAQSAVADGGFGQIEADAVVAELLG